MRFLIAGLGSIGRRHLRNLQALGQRNIILFRTLRSTLPDDDLAGLPVETDLQKALGSGPQAVIVSNPTALHLPVAIPAAEAGCHILLEKPISHSMEGVPALAQALQHGGGRLLVGYQFRFHPGLQRIERLLRDGAIGRPLSLHAHWGEYLPGWHPWEDYRQSYSARQDLGGGVVLTLSHTLDYALWLLGPVEALWAFTSRHSDLELQVEDSAEIGLQFTSGATGSIHLDYYQRPPAHYLEIIGSEGTLRWDNEDGAVHLCRAPRAAWETFSPPPGFERNHLFMAEMRHFIDVVQGKTEPVCNLEDGRRALQLALAVLEAAQQGTRVTIHD